MLREANTSNLSDRDKVLACRLRAGTALPDIRGSPGPLRLSALGTTSAGLGQLLTEHQWPEGCALHPTACHERVER